MLSLIKKSKIRGVIALKHDLGYGDGNPRSKEFDKSVLFLRKSFMRSQRLKGNGIRQWDSEEHQNALDEMVRLYLEEQEFGKHFWPDQRSQSGASMLQYSTDSARIKDTMKQLLWKVNDQYYRNKENRKKGNSGMSGKKRRKAPSQDLGADTDVDGAVSATRDATGTPDTPRSSTFNNQNDSPLDVQIDTASSRVPMERATNADPYRVPDSPNPQILSPQTRFPSTGILNDGRQVAPIANMEPCAELSRAHDNSESTRMSSKRAWKQPAGVGKSRVSPRKRKPRNIPGRATSDEVQEALQPPERNPEDVGSLPPAEVNNAVTDTLALWNHDRENRDRATISELTDEEVSVSGFIGQLNADTGLDSTGKSNSTNHAGPSTQPPATETAPQPSIEIEPDLRQTSPKNPSASYSFPSEGRETVDDRPPEKKTTPRVPSPVEKARVEFMYCVVCRYPERQSFYWKPEGSFRNKTLSMLEQELPIHVEWSQFQYMHFRLTAPNTRAEHLVRRGREDQFDSLKRRLSAIIRDCIADTPRGKTVLVEIDIEPLSDENAFKKSMDNDAMDFEW